MYGSYSRMNGRFTFASRPFCYTYVERDNRKTGRREMVTYLRYKAYDGTHIEFGDDFTLINGNTIGNLFEMSPGQWAEFDVSTESIEGGIEILIPECCGFALHDLNVAFGLDMDEWPEFLWFNRTTEPEFHDFNYDNWEKLSTERVPDLRKTVTLVKRVACTQKVTIKVQEGRTWTRNEVVEAAKNGENATGFTMYPEEEYSYIEDIEDEQWTVVNEDEGESSVEAAAA